MYFWVSLLSQHKRSLDLIVDEKSSIYLHAGLVSGITNWSCFWTENLCIRPTTVLTQSSTYQKHDVDFANDRNKRSEARCCARTDDKHPKAWLQVDLGQPFSIKNVQLYFANDGTMKFNNYHSNIMFFLCRMNNEYNKPFYYET